MAVRLVLVLVVDVGVVVDLGGDGDGDERRPSPPSSLSFSPPRFPHKVGQFTHFPIRRRKPV